MSQKQDGGVAGAHRLRTRARDSGPVPPPSRTCPPRPLPTLPPPRGEPRARPEPAPAKLSPGGGPGVGSGAPARPPWTAEGKEKSPVYLPPPSPKTAEKEGGPGVVVGEARPGAKLSPKDCSRVPGVEKGARVGGWEPLNRLTAGRGRGGSGGDGGGGWGSGAWELGQENCGASWARGAAGVPPSGTQSGCRARLSPDPLCFPSGPHG